MIGGDGADDGEIKKLLKVWIISITSLSYCYLISSRFPKGLARILSLLPIISLFTLLPLNLSNFHFIGVTSFFLTWLANFKLLLFAFDQGPLSSPTKLFHFILVASLPIKIKPHPPPKSPPKPSPSHQNSKNINKSHQPQFPRPIIKPILLLIKVVILVLLFLVYDYREYFSHYVLLCLYCFHMYLELEMLLSVFAIPARFLGFELEPQFNEPYLTTSLQDFWGSRWNLMVTSILRPTVYYPVRRISMYIIGASRKDWAQLLGVVATFVVSGLMHELIYYYFARVHPTWEVTWFFVLHGVCVAIEIVVKRVVADRWRLHRAVSGPLSLGFLAATGFWLFFPQLLRNKSDEKALREMSILVDFIKRVVKL
ncbi:hypothetical protein Ddye_027655 [Dipteronia dyeriana]|uniref:Wax synthase domain-containing protein n=1 Tax=Dipteronia dyeriana TaxID=168575 RepID=A0AAD9TPJ3_9ROSI|nr:hypothetical protein Ddye_027655 [Dipteronia dyeriana]